MAMDKREKGEGYGGRRKQQAACAHRTQPTVRRRCPGSARGTLIHWSWTSRIQGSRFGFAPCPPRNPHGLRRRHEKRVTPRARGEIVSVPASACASALSRIAPVLRTSLGDQAARSAMQVTQASPAPSVAEGAAHWAWAGCSPVALRNAFDAWADEGGSKGRRGQAEMVCDSAKLPTSGRGLVGFEREVRPHMLRASMQVQAGEGRIMLLVHALWTRRTQPSRLVQGCSRAARVLPEAQSGSQAGQATTHAMISRETIETCKGHSPTPSHYRPSQGRGVREERKTMRIFRPKAAQLPRAQYALARAHVASVVARPALVELRDPPSLARPRSQLLAAWSRRRAEVVDRWPSSSSPSFLVSRTVRCKLVSRIHLPAAAVGGREGCSSFSYAPQDWSSLCRQRCSRGATSMQPSRTPLRFKVDLGPGRQIEARAMDTVSINIDFEHWPPPETPERRVALPFWNAGRERRGGEEEDG
ncbi:hypothetical protein RJ55_04450 [Drechmeria coniospora]|nr:hypothetical protein RJ55_04450 [Drechmeria coniospora]